METEEIPSRGERTSEAILLAARRLFIERGYHGTSMRQIAQEAGIALGGIYNHFDSKEDIFVAVFLQYHPYKDVLPAMNAAQGDSIDELIRDAARRMVGALGERTDFLNLMFIELVEFNGKHFDQLFETIFPQVMQFAQHFLQNNEDLRPIPLPILVRAFIGLFFSYVITDLFLGKQLPEEMQHNALDYFVDIYLYGILEQR